MLVHVIFWIYIITLVVTSLSLFSSIILRKSLTLKFYNEYIKFLIATALILLSFTIFYFIFKYGRGVTDFLNKLYIVVVICLGINVAYSMTSIGFAIVKPPAQWLHKLFISDVIFSYFFVIFFTFIYYSPLILTISLVLSFAFFIILFILFIISFKKNNITNIDTVFVLMLIISFLCIPLDYAEFFIHRKFNLSNTFLPQGIIVFTFYCLIIHYLNLLYNIKKFYAPVNNDSDYEDVPSGFTKEFSITKREKEVIEYIVKGYNSRDIGGYLKISPRTVDRHVYNVYKKCEINTRIELMNLIRTYQ